MGHFPREGIGLILLIPLGAVLALAGWSTAGITIAVIGFIATIVIHLTAGILDYRRAMDHQWPPVDPLEDDEDWW